MNLKRKSHSRIAAWGEFNCLRPESDIGFQLEIVFSSWRVSERSPTKLENVLDDFTDDTFRLSPVLVFVFQCNFGASARTRRELSRLRNLVKTFRLHLSRFPRWKFSRIMRWGEDFITISIWVELRHTLIEARISPRQLQPFLSTRRYLVHRRHRHRASERGPKNGGEWKTAHTINHSIDIAEFLSLARCSLTFRNFR